MPFDAAHADPVPAHTASPAALRVVPCLDATSGSVLLYAGGRQGHYTCAEPQRLLRALSRTVRPVLWFPAERKLLLAVAARGYRDGKELCFTLE